MNFDEKVKYCKQLTQEIADLEVRRKTLLQEILQEMPKDKNAVVSGTYKVMRYRRFVIKTTIEEARAYDAVSLEEVVNKDRLKKLHIMGHLIPNVSQYEYIAISLPKEIKTDSPLEERN